MHGIVPCVRQFAPISDAMMVGGMNGCSGTSKTGHAGGMPGLDVHQQSRVSIVVRAEPRIVTVVAVMMAMMPVVMAMMPVPAVSAAMAMAATPMDLRHAVILRSNRCRIERRGRCADRRERHEACGRGRKCETFESGESRHDDFSVVQDRVTQVGGGLRSLNVQE